jgi:hypothetical protein
VSKGPHETAFFLGPSFVLQLFPVKGIAYRVFISLFLFSWFLHCCSFGNKGFASFHQVVKELITICTFLVLGVKLIQGSRLATKHKDCQFMFTLLYLHNYDLANWTMPILQLVSSIVVIELHHDRREPTGANNGVSKDEL